MHTPTCTYAPVYLYTVYCILPDYTCILLLCINEPHEAVLFLWEGEGGANMCALQYRPHQPRTPIVTARLRGTDVQPTVAILSKNKDI